MYCAHFHFKSLPFYFQPSSNIAVFLFVFASSHNRLMEQPISMSMSVGPKAAKAKGAKASSLGHSMSYVSAAEGVLKFDEVDAKTVVTAGPLFE